VEHWDGPIRTSDKGFVMGPEQRGRVRWLIQHATGNGMKRLDATKMKSFNIDKKLVYDGYKAVKANAGAAGVDGQTLEQFDKDLTRNLYKIWNRTSSGCSGRCATRARPPVSKMHDSELV